MKKQTLKKQKLPNKTFLGQKIGKSLGMYNNVLQSRGLHPSMSPFLIGNRKNIALISQDLTLKSIVKTLFLVFSILKQNGHILVVNTNPEFINLINNFALKTNKIGAKISYCNSKWVGGTLTNWNQISKSIVSFSRFSERFGEFIMQNNIHFPKYKKLKKCFEGYISLIVGHEKTSKNISVYTSSGTLITPRGTERNPKGVIAQRAYESVHSDIPSSSNSNSTILNHTIKKPNVLFVLNPNENHIVLNEAKHLKIPIIALTDTNTDISLVTYPIPVNNQSTFFIHFYLSWILRIIKVLEKKRY